MVVGMRAGMCFCLGVCCIGRGCSVAFMLCCAVADVDATL